MTFFGAVFLFPAVLALSSLGAGLLVDRISGSWLPAPAIPVVGFAALVGIGQITTSSAAVAPVTAGAFVFAAAGGYVLSISRLRNLLGSLRRSPWVLFSCIIAYGIAIAPVLLAGRTSLAFYLTDTTTGTHLAGADWLIANGRNFGDLPLDSSYGLQLRAYFEASNYPSGGHVVLAALGQLIPVRLTWLYQPYMATALALLAPSAYVLLGKAGMRSAPAALGAVLVSVPALVYALDLTGSIKELTALSQIMLLGVLVSEHRRWLHLAPGAGIPLGIAVGAGLSAIGAPFAAWGFAAAAAVLPAAISRVGSRTWPWWRALALGGTIIAAAAVMAPAVVSNISQSTATANGIATTTDPGNLLQPLDPLQAFGIWITGQYRFPPGEHLGMTYALLGLAFLCVPFGVLAFTRRKEYALVIFLGLMGLLWWQLTLRGTTWTDGKMILLSSPFVVLVVVAGPAWFWRQGQRVLAVTLFAAVGVGILYSDAMQYHVTNLAPTERFDELAVINDQFAGQGPTLATDFDEFIFYELRDLEVSAPGFAYRSPAVASANVGYGQTADIDTLPQSALAGQRLIVQRRSPASSRPPSNYTLAKRGAFYDVWKRQETTTILARLGSSKPLSTQSVQTCGDVSELAARAREKAGKLAVARRAPVIEIPAGSTARSPSWIGTDSLALTGPGRLDTTFRARQAGDYEIALKAQLGRKLRVQIDGREVGRIGEQTAGAQNFSTPVRIRLSKGRHRLSLVRPGGSLRPGDDAPSTLDGIVVSPARNDSRISFVSPSDYQQLCGQLTDWIEAVT